MAKERPIPRGLMITDLEVTDDVITGVYDIYGKVYDDLGLDKIIQGSSDDDKFNKIIKALVLSRVAHPNFSKVKIAKKLANDYDIDFPLHKYYQAMDKLVEVKDEVMCLVFAEGMRWHKDEVENLLIDITTTYFKSFVVDDFRQPGSSENNESKELVMSLVTTDEGFPISYKIFHGNTAECQTLIDHTSEVLANHPALQGANLAADRGMSNDKIFSHLENKKINLKYVIASKLRQLPQDKQARIFSDKDAALARLGEDKEWAKSYPWEGKGRRFVVGYCPKRAERDRQLREEILAKILEKNSDGQVKVSELERDKYLDTRSKELKIDAAKVAKDAWWDGLSGLVTNHAPCRAKQVFSRYRELWKIEDAFRFLKSDLDLRPMRHWTRQHIEAHFLICYLALAITKFLQAKVNAELEANKRLSIAECQMLVSMIKSFIMGNKRSNDNYLYLFPKRLTEEQQRIYDALDIAYRKDNIRILSPPNISRQLQGL